jgi:rod shape determining protein RodA
MAVDYAHARGARAKARRLESADAVSFARRLDWVMLAGVGALVAFGLWAIAGVTRDDVPGDPDYFVFRQALHLAVGVAAFIAVLLVDPDVYRRHRRALLGGLLALLVIVLALGSAVRGSQRWIDLGITQFQPSEFGKLAVILFVAGFLADRGRRAAEAGTVLAAVGIALIPTLLVFLQPDFGTSLVYAAAVAGVLFVAQTRWSHLVALAGAVAAAAAALVWLLPAAGIHVLRPYQSARLLAFANPDVDPGGTGYNMTQSITAVGAGGLTGRGVENATQTRYDYLPEHATDFVFASIAEQRGFVGSSLLLALYLLVIWRGLRVIPLARDYYSALVAGGIVVALLFQVFVNVGMTMGIAPITGIPLPYVSVGGSSLIMNLIAIGILQAIHARGRARAPRVR